MEGNLPKGFISVQKAIELINSHTKEKPTVDILFLVDNAFRVRTARNFTIKRPKVDAKGKVARDEKGKFIEDVPIFVQIKKDLERELLRDAITNKFREFTGQELNIAELGIKKITTAVDDETGTTARPQANTKSTIKLGDEIKSGSTVTTNKG